MTLTALDLFSGIGGFSLGLERAGIRTAAFCEIDSYARRVLRRHWPETPIYEDVRTLTADTLRRDGIAVDCITGGFPCQDVSLAGKRAGIAGERSGLWSEYARLIRELRPGWVIVENVPGLLSDGMGRVLGDLAACGYDALWDCVPASAIGAPHRRDRVWIVAHANGQGEYDCAEHAEMGGAQKSMANPERQSLALGESVRCDDGAECSAIERGGSPLSNAARDRRSTEGQRSQARHAHRSDQLRREPEAHWLAEPDVGRVADGVPSRMDRLRCLGNSVVPQIPELIARAILETEQSE